MAKSVNGEKPAMRSHKGFLRFLTGRYLSQTMCKNLLQYKYDGEDRSYLYRFVLQPMNAFLIRFVPIWAAPNLLTLSGLMLMVIGYLMTYYYAPTFETVMPSWCYLACSFVLYGYQTIDNLDGRQARRTGSSSPLGLLFDHGVDALNCTFASLLLAAVYSIGNLGPVLLFLFWNIGFIPFVVATWEEYFTGKLTLAEVNGPSDGMALCMLFSSFGFFFPGIYHQSYGQAVPLLFKGTAVADLPFNTFPLIIGYLGIAATLVGNAFQVSKKVNGWTRPLSKLIPFVVMSALAWSWVLLDPEFFRRHARVFCFSLGFLFCQMICSLMIAHVCHQDYAVRRPVLIPLVLAWINCAGGPRFLPKVFPLVDPDLVILVLLAFNFSAWFHFIANAILEICELLNIRCFTIVPKLQGHDGSTVQAVQAHQAREAAEAAAARHTGINPLSPSSSQSLLDTYQVTPSPLPPRETRSSSRKKSNAD